MAEASYPGGAASIVNKVNADTFIPEIWSDEIIAAYQKNLAHLNGGRNHLPAPVDKPATLGKPERHGHNY